MSIQDHLAELIKAGRLRPFLPRFGGRVVRRLLLTEELHRELTEPGAYPLEYGIGFLTADLERFVVGGRQTFGMGSNNHCTIKVLDDWSDEIWEIRSRREKPGVRVFGRFVLPDVFVATAVVDRKELGNDFDVEKRRCGAAWRQLFYSYEPYRGANPDDYITSNLIDLRVQ